MLFHDGIQPGQASHGSSRLFLKASRQNFLGTTGIPKLVGFDNCCGVLMKFGVLFHQFDKYRIIAKLGFPIAVYPFAQHTGVIHTYIAWLKAFFGTAFKIIIKALFPGCMRQHGIVHIDYLGNFFRLGF